MGNVLFNLDCLNGAFIGSLLHSFFQFRGDRIDKNFGLVIAHRKDFRTGIHAQSTCGTVVVNSYFHFQFLSLLDLKWVYCYTRLTTGGEAKSTICEL